MCEYFMYRLKTTTRKEKTYILALECFRLEWFLLWALGPRHLSAFGGASLPYPLPASALYWGGLGMLSFALVFSSVKPWIWTLLFVLWFVMPFANSALLAGMLLSVRMLVQTILSFSLNENLKEVLLNITAMRKGSNF